jgi:hypothetical protein
VVWRLRVDELIFIGWEPEAPTGPRALYAVGIDRTGARELVPAPDSGTLAVMTGDVVDSDPGHEAADRGVRTPVIVEVDEPRERS